MYLQWVEIRSSLWLFEMFLEMNEVVDCFWLLYFFFFFSPPPSYPPILGTDLQLVWKQQQRRMAALHLRVDGTAYDVATEQHPSDDQSGRHVAPLRPTGAPGAGHGHYLQSGHQGGKNCGRYPISILSNFAFAIFVFFFLQWMVWPFPPVWTLLFSFNWLIFSFSVQIDWLEFSQVLSIPHSCIHLDLLTILRESRKDPR